MDQTSNPPAFVDLGAVTEHILQQGSDFPAFSTRTCWHRGRETTFALQDRVAWYACLACGRYA